MSWYKYIFLLLSLLVLGGCFYPAERRQQVSDLPTHIAQVQSAVELYQQQNQFLPYLYKEEDRKLTTKYLVDLKAVSGYGAAIPPTAFEKGGNFLYVLTDLERKPLVRVYDLRVGDEMDKLETAIRTYQKTNGKLPIQQQGEHYHQIDFAALHMDPIYIPSPYHVGMKLPVIMDDQGRVYVDYRTDIARFLQEKKEPPAPDEDLRLWLSRIGPFVPAYSAPVQLMDNQEPKLLPYREE